MGNSYGIRSLDKVGKSIQLLANDKMTRWKVGAVTMDWALVTAVGPVTLEDGVEVPAGEKYLRYGQVITVVTATGRYAPFLGTAGNGQEVLGRGTTFLINETVLESETESNHPGALEAGRVFKARLLASAAGSATLPTYAALEAALPGLFYVPEM